MKGDRERERVCIWQPTEHCELGCSGVEKGTDGHCDCFCNVFRKKFADDYDVDDDCYYCYFQVIAAEGEQKASRALKEAAEIITESPAALQLRYLQTLNSISSEKNSTIIFPLPIDMMKGFLK